MIVCTELPRSIGPETPVILAHGICVDLAGSFPPIPNGLPNKAIKSFQPLLILSRTSPNDVPGVGIAGKYLSSNMFPTPIPNGVSAGNGTPMADAVIALTESIVSVVVVPVGLHPHANPKKVCNKLIPYGAAGSPVNPLIASATEVCALSSVEFKSV